MSPSSRFQPLVIQFLSQTAVAASLLFVPLIVRDLGGRGIEMGLVVGGYNAAFLLGNIYGGRAGDIVPRRWVVRAGLLLATTAFSLQTLALVEGYPLWLFALSRILGGMTVGMFPNALLAFVYEDTGRVGLFTSAGSLGWGAGMLLAGVISFFPHVFLASTVLLAGAFLVAMTLSPIGEKRMDIPLFPWSLIKKNWRPYLALLIRHTGASMIWVTFPIYLSILGADRFWIGVTYAVNMATQFSLMPFLERFSPRNLVRSGLLLSSATFLVFTLVRTWWEMIPTQVMLGAGWAMLYVGTLRCVLDRNEEKATVSGIAGSVLSLSGIIGPLVGGPLSDIVGYKTVMAVASLMALGALAVFSGDGRETGM
ncbi:MAG: MFS transporter [Thermoplasmata archaeon]|nr:MFS transporter [Thermoplasmata archaeon]